MIDFWVILKSSIRPSMQNVEIRNFYAFLYRFLVVKYGFLSLQDSLLLIRTYLRHWMAVLSSFDQYPAKVFFSQMRSQSNLLLELIPVTKIWTIVLK